jgi:HlyD family secretion protein
MPPPTEKSGRSIVGIALMFVTFAIGLVLGGGGVYIYDKDIPKASDHGPDVPDTSHTVVALGRIEPRDGILSLGVAAPDRILEIKVKEDDPVKEKQPLVIFDSRKMRELEQQMAAIQRSDASTRLKAIEENGNAQIFVAQLRHDRVKDLELIDSKMLTNKLKLLHKQQENAQRNYDRYVKAGDTIAGMDKERQKLAEQQIQTDIDATKDQLAKLSTSTALDFRLTEAQLKAAKAELQQTRSTISLEVLDKQVTQADERLGQSELLAPSDGKILRVFMHKGDLVQSKTILQMANIDNMIVVAEVDEKDIKRVKEKQSVTITSPSGAFDEKCNEVKGQVIWIANNVGKAEMIPLDPRAAVSDRVVQVKIAVDNSECVAKLIGLQVQVQITVQESTEKTH